MERYNPLSPAKTLEERKQQALHQCDHLIKDFAKRDDRHKALYKSIAFTERFGNVRVISARLATKEREDYEQNAL